MSAVTRRSASIRCCSASAMASTARARSSVSSRTTPPMASRTRTSVSPLATWFAAAAALRSRPDSCPPISTPSALPPKTTETEPMTSAWSRSFITSVERSGIWLCRDSTCPSLVGTAAQMSGAPPWSMTSLALRPVVTFLSSAAGRSRSSSLTFG